MAMGIHDREYSRDDEPSYGYQAGLPRSAVSMLIAVNVALFLADMLMATGKDIDHHWLTKTLSLTPDTFAKPWLWWKYITYGFAHSHNDIRHILFNMMGLWFFGRAVEERDGRREFLTYYFTAIALCGVVWNSKFFVFANMPDFFYLLGASGAVTAVVLLNVLRNPMQTVLLFGVVPAPAWVLGVLIVLGDIIGTQAAQNGVAHDVHLTGSALASCYFFLQWRLSNWLPRFGWLSRLGLGAKQLTGSRPQLRVRSAEADDAYQSQDEEADRILAKLHAQGDASLTPKERRILEDYSRRMRQKHR